MKILKSLNKFLLLLVFILFFNLSSLSNEPVDIWSIENNIEEFLVWKEKRKNVPIIQQLKIKTETTSENEVKNAIKKFEKGIPIDAVLSELATKISNKFLHNAYIALKDQNSEKYSEIKYWIKKLYGIDLDD